MLLLWKMGTGGYWSFGSIGGDDIEIECTKDNAMTAMKDPDRRPGMNNI
jgi:hypothetical protein